MVVHVTIGMFQVALKKRLIITANATKVISEINASLVRILYETLSIIL